MAGALWKKEVVIRPSSTISVSGAQTWTQNWLASFQDDPDNIDTNGGYIDYFFGDLFDARTGNLYRIFSTASGVKYDMDVTIFDVLITSRFIPWTSVSNNSDMAQDADMLATRGTISNSISSRLAEFLVTLYQKFIQLIHVSDNPDLAVDDDFIITRGGIKNILEDTIKNASVINDADILQGDTMQLAHIPKGGIIGAKATVKISGSVYDEVDCLCVNNVLTISPDTPGEYDGKVCMVSYLINT